MTSRGSQCVGTVPRLGHFCSSPARSLAEPMSLARPPNTANFLIRCAECLPDKVLSPRAKGGSNHEGGMHFPPVFPSRFPGFFPRFTPTLMREKKGSQLLGRSWIAWFMLSLDFHGPRVSYCRAGDDGCFPSKMHIYPLRVPGRMHVPVCCRTSASPIHYIPTKIISIHPSCIPFRRCHHVDRRRFPGEGKQDFSCP